jgi:hypothetical protein
MTMPEDESVVVRITLADIYRQLVALAASVNAALTRAERSEQVLAEHETELRPLAGAADRIIDHESRLRSLERGRWPLPALTIVMALASLVLAVGVAIDGK